MNQASLVYGNTILVNYKKTHPKAITPFYSREEDAGLDLVSVGITDWTSTYTEHDTGIAVELPPGYCGLIIPRSSQSNYRQILANNVGLLDSNFRGSIKIRFRDLDVNAKEYKPGDKIAQLLILPYPKIIMLETTKLNDSDRGTKGLGSSGE